MSKSNLSKKSSRNKSSVSNKKATKIRKAQTGKFIDVDRSISTMAKKGKLTYPGENAIRRSFKKGLSVTVMEDDGIYKVHPDGTRIRVKKQSQVYRDSETGKFYKKK